MKYQRRAFLAGVGGLLTAGTVSGNQSDKPFVGLRVRSDPRGCGRVQLWYIPNGGPSWVRVKIGNQYFDMAAEISREVEPGRYTVKAWALNPERPPGHQNGNGGGPEEWPPSDNAQLGEPIRVEPRTITVPSCE